MYTGFCAIGASASGGDSKALSKKISRLSRDIFDESEDQNDGPGVRGCAWIFCSMTVRSCASVFVLDMSEGGVFVGAFVVAGYFTDCFTGCFLMIDFGAATGFFIILAADFFTGTGCFLFMTTAMDAIGIASATVSTMAAIISIFLFIG